MLCCEILPLPLVLVRLEGVSDILNGTRFKVKEAIGKDHSVLHCVAGSLPSAGHHFVTG